MSDVLPAKCSARSGPKAAAGCSNLQMVYWIVVYSRLCEAATACVYVEQKQAIRHCEKRLSQLSAQSQRKQSRI